MASKAGVAIGHGLVEAAHARFHGVAFEAGELVGDLQAGNVLDGQAGALAELVHGVGGVDALDEGHGPPMVRPAPRVGSRALRLPNCLSTCWMPWMTAGLPSRARRMLATASPLGGLLCVGRGGATRRGR